MSQVLGRVITGVLEIPRGPDVMHRIAVERSLFVAGAEIALTLPRNLTCAACSGGGCDGCERAGAITLRERGEPPEVLRVILPPRSAAEIEKDPAVVLRVPDQGGFPAPESQLPRGLLFLKVEASDASDSGIATTLAPKKKSRWPARLSRAVPSQQPSFESQDEGRRSLLSHASVILAVSWVLLTVAYSASLP